MEKRGSVTIKTIEKVKRFLDKQKTPIFKSLIGRECGVNASSLDIVIKQLDSDYTDKIKKRKFK